MATKYVYFFGGGKAEGNESMKNLLGGKGANLAEMAGHKNLRLPVPPGFSITTEVCAYYYKNRKTYPVRNTKEADIYSKISNGTYPKGLKEEVEKALQRVEVLMARKFGDPDNPLLVSVRSGARRSMPGMMETVLNVGLTEKTIPGLIKQSGGNSRFVYDAYRRLIMMYSDVVMEKAAGVELANEESGIRKQLERIMSQMKKEKGCTSDTDLTGEDLKKLCTLFKAKIR